MRRASAVQTTCGAEQFTQFIKDQQRDSAATFHSRGMFEQSKTIIPGFCEAKSRWACERVPEA